MTSMMMKMSLMTPPLPVSESVFSDVDIFAVVVMCQVRRKRRRKWLVLLSME